MLPVKCLVFLLYFNALLHIFDAATYYLITERPVIQFMNPKYISFLNISSRRHGRKNPMYYYDIYFYEYVYNEYRRSLLEFHFKWCNLFKNDKFFAETLRKILPAKCPHPAGTYHLDNMTLNADAIPEGFPFTKGRMQVNVSYRGEPMAAGYGDLELKKIKKPKP